MPAVFRIHEIVKKALINEGWTITADPLVLTYSERKLFIDLGAERIIGAHKGNVRIAVEVKTFAGPSPIREVQQALGQYIMYKAVLERESEPRIPFIALSQDFYDTFFQEPLGGLMIDNYSPNLLVVDVNKEVVSRWFPKVI